MFTKSRLFSAVKYRVGLLWMVGILTTMILPAQIMAVSSVSVSGPTEVRAGQTIQISLNLTGENVQGALGTIRYDANQLTYVKAEDVLSGWESTAFNPSDGSIVFVGAGSGAPITGTKKLFSMTFILRSDIPAGETIRIQAVDLATSDGASDDEPADTAFSVTVLPPLATNNNLGTLTVGNARISPDFSPAVLSYTTTVPFSVSRLTVTAAAQDSKATVSLNNPALAVGTTTIRITVTAENRSTRTYTIQVTRQQDPQYQPSANANLRSLTPSMGILSPGFSAAKTEYIVYLPAEAISFKATGIADDQRAQKVQAGEIELIPGANPYEITVTAENGDKKIYRITVMKMPSIEEIALLTPGTESKLYDDESGIESNDLIPSGTNRDPGVPKIGAILLAVWTFIVGGIIAYLFAKKRFSDE
jgi:hypothetical protein